MWLYEPDRNVWTFLRGFTDIAQRSNYGTRGVTQEGTFPQARHAGSMVVDSFTQQLYLFGGVNDDGFFNSLNDLWVFDLNSLLWTWIAGSNAINARGRYGTMGVSSPLNNPPSRGWNMFAFHNETRQIILYGGAKAGVAFYADLWSYSVSDFVFNGARTTTSIGSTRTRASSTIRTTTAQRGGVSAPRSSSAISSDLVGLFISVPLLNRWDISPWYRLYSYKKLEAYLC